MAYDAELAATISALRTMKNRAEEAEAECARLREYVREADRRLGGQVMAAQNSEEKATRYAMELLKQTKRTDEATELLHEAFDWIRNWSPNFTNDEEWEPVANHIAAFLKGRLTTTPEGER